MRRLRWSNYEVVISPEFYWTVRHVIFDSLRGDQVDWNTDGIAPDMETAEARARAAIEQRKAFLKLKTQQRLEREAQTRRFTVAD